MSDLEDPAVQGADKAFQDGRRPSGARHRGPEPPSSVTGRAEATAA
jgi:hypothetical protein